MLDLQEQIKSLEYRQKELMQDIAVEDTALQALAAQAKALSVGLEQKRERHHHLEYAINNIRSVIELETPVSGIDKIDDPWGES